MLAHALTSLLTLALIVVIIAGISMFLFGGPSVGFRIIYYFMWDGSPDHLDSLPMQPDRPDVPKGAQLGFLAIIALLALVTYASSYYWFSRLLV